MDFKSRKPKLNVLIFRMGTFLYQQFEKLIPLYLRVKWRPFLGLALNPSLTLLIGDDFLLPRLIKKFIFSETLKPLSPANKPADFVAKV